jgi:aldose 1-epimerase
MYELSTESYGPFLRYTLRNEALGHRFSVVPEAGATILELELGSVSVLDHPASPEELANNAAGKSSLLFPFPNRLDAGKFEWEGKAYEFPINDERTGNAIHGFVRESSFDVDRIVLARNYASIVCSYHYSGQLPYYPFNFQFDIEYSIFDHGIFRVAPTCRNLHFYAIPIGFGWHPYFRLAEHADEVRLQLPPCERQEIDERMLPTGDRTPYTEFRELKPLGTIELDTAFGVDPGVDRYEVVLAAGGRRLIMRAERAQFPYFMVFTPGDRQTVALEPMSCNMNGFNTGDHLVALEPDAEWKAMVEFELKKDKTPG